MKVNWITRLKESLSKTAFNLKSLIVNKKIDKNLYNELESDLLKADVGFETTQFLLNKLKKIIDSKKLFSTEQIKNVLHDLLVNLLKSLEKPLILKSKPFVIMIVGVNGVGKTTTIGKLANYFKKRKKSVLLAACDTFRAAAYEQLLILGKYNDVPVITEKKITDPAAIAFNAINVAQKKNIDIVIVDTSGRLSTQSHLMRELKKIKKVIEKKIFKLPYEIFLIIDGNTGQNTLSQIKEFSKILHITGLIITKLDGTTKGGILAAIAKKYSIPLYFIGIGEKIEDLQIFNAVDFVNALLN
ncbi:signal recognition particle-docking protein FtsY [Candidatus Profftella armatura (Diaphorina cf. continua)]|uniref:Signal recognition particle receptor FtsY n=1 Tax=Candidatus Profftella armatura (Diaphorina cf. continua) TaxID=2661583 RepID=A0A7R7ABQ4_9PROT|nr:signal recognition particle-docking protein FtsY [Candidatus Profftella armatura (Diaphorina cf. continua)]BCG49638.1 signal recognition particle-docking protein FtsY [Candidatus Profftella armatura (Diaphorina cf. continua)]